MRLATATLGVLVCTAVLAAAPPSLRDAVRSGDLEAVRSLLDSGVDVNARDSLGATPLLDAAWYGNEQIVRLLVEGGARVDVTHEEGGSTPLDYAVLRGNAAIVRLLLDRGAQSDRALFTAASHGQAVIAQVLIECGAKVGTRDESGSAPLDLAAFEGDPATVRVLLAAGAKADERHPGTRATPLQRAAAKDNAAVVSVLLVAGADPAAQDRDGRTALEIAAANGAVGAAAVLLDQGHRPSDSLTRLLRAAVARGDARMVSLLAAHGADPKTQSPLATAACKGFVEVVEALLQLGAPVDGKDSTGASPLYNAALNGHADVAALLLRHGAAVNLREAQSGDTALYAAASLGHLPTAVLLLRHGADPNIANKSGHRPVYAASSNGFPELAAEIARRGGR
jgi:ankyrin repeat protein